MIAASERLVPLLRQDWNELKAVGLEAETLESLVSQLNELKGLSKDPRAKKNETPLPMNEVVRPRKRRRKSRCPSGPARSRSINGADGTRTRALRAASASLSQLSYGPKTA